MIQLGGFLGRILDPLLRTGLPLIKHVIQSLAKSVLIPLGLTAAASTADAGIHEILGPGHTTTLTISNDEMEDVLKIVKSLENSGLLLEEVREKIKDEATEQTGGFLSTLLGTLEGSLLGNMLAGKSIMRAGKGTARVGCGSRRSSFKKQLIPPHPLTSFEIQMYYQNEPRFNGVYCRENLTAKITDGAYVVNLDQYSGIATDWIAMGLSTVQKN